DPVNHRADIKTLHPSVSRAIVEQTKISAIPWQRTGQGESRRCELTRDAKALRVRVNLELGPGEPCSIHRECQPSVISVAKNRRIQDINRFIVEAFEDCA